MKTLPIVALLLGSFLAATPVPAQVLRHETSPRPLPGATSWDFESRTGTVIVHVVDADRGRSIPGAVVLLIAESDQPLGGPPEPVARFVADEDGLVTIVVDEKTAPWNWLIADAPGFAPLGIFSCPDEEICLRRGERRAVRFLDPRLRPLEGLELECLVGCGHTPTVRRGRADADGLVVMEDVSARSDGILEYWVRHPSVAPEYVDIPDPLADGSPPTVVLPFGRTVSGVVFDSDGRPRADVRVGGCTGAHRGPWVATDAEGRFRLVGVPHGTQNVEVVVPPRLGSGTELRTEPTSHFVTLPPPEVPLEIRLGPDDQVTNDLETREIVITVEDDRGPLEDIEAVLWHADDGRSARGWSDASGRIVLAVGSGDSWRLRLEDPAFAHAPRTVPIAAGESAIRVRLERRPVRLVEIRAPIDRGPTSVDLLVGDRERRISFDFVLPEPAGSPRDHDLYRARIPVAETGDPVLSIPWDPEGRTLPALVPLEASSEPLILIPPRRSQVRVVAARAPDGAPVGFDAWTVDIRPEGLVVRDSLGDPDLAASLESPFEGDEDDEAERRAPRIFEIDPGETGRLCFRPCRADLDLFVMSADLSRLPSRTDGVAELTLDFASKAPPLVRVRWADGAPAAGAWIELTPDHGVELDEEGTWSPPAVVADGWRGRTLRILPPVSDDGPYAPMTVDIPASGGIEARWPAGSVLLRFPAADDENADQLDLIVDDGNLMELEAERGDADRSVRVSGLTPGRHRLLVGRRGFLTERIEFEVGEGANELEIDLLARRR